MPDANGSLNPPHDERVHAQSSEGPSARRDPQPDTGPVSPESPPSEPASPPPPGLTHTRASSLQPSHAEPTATTGVPHYSPPATLDRLLGRPSGPDSVRPQTRSIFPPLGRGLREIAETIVLALVIFLLVRAVVQNFQVEGSSMNPTFENGWFVLVNKAIYWEINLDTVSKFIPFVDPGDDPTRYIFRGPKRGDVIVFKAPPEAGGAANRDFIKRIIGLPGETVEVHDCHVFIDGLPLFDEPYIQDLPDYTYGPETVPPDHYFVLGDNRNNSLDSHEWGMLPKQNIIGEAWLIYWPRSAFGLVDNNTVTPMEPDPLPEPFSNLSPVRCPGS